MPNNETLVWITKITQWIDWYDYVREASGWYDATCPEYIKDDPSSFNSWLNMQKEKEKSKINNSGRR